MHRGRNTGREGLITAGLLMFGKGLSIRERFDNIRMDYIDESNLLPGSRWSDRLTYDGMWENNLYNFKCLGRRKMEKEVTNTRLQSMLDLHSTEVGKLLAELVEKQMLIAKWKGRWTTYSVNTDYVIQGEQVSTADLEVPDVSLNKKIDFP